MFVCVLLAHLIVWPSDAHARHLLRKGPVISDLTGNIARAAYSTPYSGCDDESCACGVPPELLQDLHGAPLAYVALNVQVRDMGCTTTPCMSKLRLVDRSACLNTRLPMQNTGMASRKLSRPIRASSKEIGMFNNGNNCGRWVEITYQESCVGDESAGASQPPVVCGVDAVFGDPRIYYAPDSKTGIKAYALVADGCADNTYWCDLHANPCNAYCLLRQLLQAHCSVSGYNVTPRPAHAVYWIRRTLPKDMASHMAPTTWRAEPT